jgi:ABC-type lipoprotein export system ATPase subunit
LLHEIADFCANARKINRKILERITFAPVNRQTAEEDFQRIKRNARHDEQVPEGYSPVRVGQQDRLLSADDYIRCRLEPNENSEYFTHCHLAPLTLRLDGPTRIDLIDSKKQGDLKNPKSSLATLYTNNAERARWRTIVHEAFGLYPGIDALEQGHLSVKFGDTPPPNERTHENDIIEWMRVARDTAAVSDGVKAFSGILLEVYAGDPKVILIDEPEAFLHPSLARTLGRELATATSNQGKFVFVATHSAEFVMGAIQSGAIVNIVRLTYGSNVATARLLPSDELVKLMSDPMLRSVGVLAGLFYEHVCVTEGDSDRAFYQEVNERLLAARDDRAIPHALFLNADNHQTIPAILAPLRKLGIPAAGIADIDVVKLGGSQWTRQLGACGFPDGQYASVQQHRKSVLDKLIAAAPPGTPKPEDYFKIKGGIDLLAGADRESADNLFNQLDQYGLFVVRRGEVEAWLRQLNVPAKTHGWRAAIFTAMGNDPSGILYVRPGKADVWDFIGSIAKWLTDPARRGIPT